MHCGGVSAAARELGVSQPAVSQALSELENSLGARLLKRDKSGIELTPDGALFLSYAERVGALSAEVDALFAPGVERRVTIAAPAHLESAFLSPIKERYSGKISIDIVPEGELADVSLVTRPAAGDIPVGRLSVSFTAAGGNTSSDTVPVFARVSESFAKIPLYNIILGILGGKL
ncbi:MAG: LysR family transcriptional regulator [Bacteroidales bacterium]|nr:LysR family transcriptional regulator [Bacteroidales bacterium]